MFHISICAVWLVRKSYVFLANSCSANIGTMFDSVQDEPFWGWWAALSKICHSYPAMIKLGTDMLYLKKIQKNINHVTRPLTSADISVFSLEIIFCHIKKYKFRFHFYTLYLIILTYFESLKGCFSKHDDNFYDVSKIGYFRPS